MILLRSLIYLSMNACYVMHRQSSSDCPLRSSCNVMSRNATDRPEPAKDSTRFRNARVKKKSVEFL